MPPALALFTQKVGLRVSGRRASTGDFFEFGAELRALRSGNNDPMPEKVDPLTLP